MKESTETYRSPKALLRGGIASYVGTYWPVGDDGAKTFAETFYPELLDGKPIGVALKTARRKLYENEDIDWANYIHYGDPEFLVKVARI